MSDQLTPSEQKPLTIRKPYGMSRSIDSFCLHVAQGISYAESYRQAYPKAKTQNPQRLLKRPDVQERIKVLKAREWDKDRMEKAEQQAYLGRVIRAAPSEVDATSDLAQEYTEEETRNKDGSVTVVRKVKMMPKAVALQENARIEGMYYADQPQNAANSFAFLIGVFDHLSKNRLTEKQPPPIEI